MSTGSFAFDATTFEFWGPLLNGAKLVLARKEVLLDANKLFHEIKFHAVNIVWLTTGWLNKLIETNVAQFKNLKTILCGGERISSAHIAKLKEANPQLNVLNCYGPTGNTTFSLTHEIDQVIENIPIGKPINNTTVYILNKHKMLQPEGVVGEIYLGGDGVSKGYINKPDLTRERFLENPFVEHDIIYKTGDMGKWLPDGSISFMGRRDDQIKIRGHRIELGEIENALLKLDQIESAVAVARNIQEGEKTIIVYFIPGDKFDLKTVKVKLGELLPNYMLPSYYIPLEQFPLNSNGKVDKKALPIPEEYQSSNEVEYLPPRNLTEEKLIQIWGNILQKEKISIYDDFFDLGGHSLKAVHLLNEIYKIFGIQIKVKDLYNKSTVVSLAEEIDLIARLLKMQKTDSDSNTINI